MFLLNFKAKALSATKNSKDNYYMIGLADDKYDYKNYIIFQRPIKLKKGDDENSDINGIYAECDGDVCYNACKCVTITDKTIIFEVQDSIISVDIEGVKLSDRFMKYSKEIFGELLKCNMSE
ncbi:Imm10 family immunity protein [Campylobacter concisus]|uniref:Imm10 family immunity protein n=1 Tax=Campylobacter concisus TaxID=199 RepID=UPI000D2FE49E|nr:Imm10 family immunity protein [Campylobacter concisus]